jgi:hypothetical protein
MANAQEIQSPHRERRREIERKSYLKNIEKKRARARAYRAAHLEEARAYNRAYGKANRTKRRAVTYNCHLRKTYGITSDLVAKMWAEQDGKCGLCKRPMLAEGRQSLSRCVDHDHENGQLRDLLCRKCNTILGGYEKYRSEIDEYLDRHAKKGG